MWWVFYKALVFVKKYYELYKKLSILCNVFPIYNTYI
jgi:hypothetical protein